VSRIEKQQKRGAADRDLAGCRRRGITGGGVQAWWRDRRRLPAAVAGPLKYADVYPLLGGAVARAGQAAATGSIPTTPSLDITCGKSVEAVGVGFEQVIPGLGPPRSGPNLFLETTYTASTEIL